MPGFLKLLRDKHNYRSPSTLRTNFAAGFSRLSKTLTWSIILSMMGAGIASQTYSPRAIGAVAGVLSSITAIFWAWANWTGRLPEPARSGIEPDEVEVHGDPVA